MILFILCILCLFDPALDFGKYSFIFTSEQLTQQKPMPF